MGLLSFLFAASTFQLGVADLLRTQKLNPNIKIEASSLPTRYTLFAKTRNHHDLDRVLEEAPRYMAPYLSKAEVRELSGLHENDIKTMEAAMEGLGGNLLRISALADSVTIEVPPGVSHDDITRILEASTSAISQKVDGTESSIHDHIALIHQHNAGGVSSSSSSSKEGLSDTSLGTTSDRAGKKAGMPRAFPESGRRTRRLANPNSTCHPGVSGQYGFRAYAPEELANYIGLSNAPQFCVCCPNGEIEGKMNNCTSSATLFATFHYPSSGNSSSPEQRVEIEDIESLRHNYGDLYFYVIPVRYFKPNVMYDDAHVTITTTDNQLLQFNTSTTLLTTKIVNVFNATGPSLKKELFEVPEQYQGRVDQVQLTSGAPVNGFFYDPQYVSSYLDMQGISGYNMLEIKDNWFPPYSTNDPHATGKEPMLDVEVLQSIAPKATTKAVSGGVNDTTPVEDQLEAWNRFFDQFMDEENPGVISWSWSDQSFILALYQSLSLSNPHTSQGERLANAFQIAESKLKKLAARGFTILVSSGDQGASGNGGSPAGSCISSTENNLIRHESYDGKEFLNWQFELAFDINAAGVNVGYLRGNQLNNWPTYSEWVTSVGGTQLLSLDEDGKAVEVACSGETGCGVTSGGGFTGSAPPLAATYKRPNWQDEQVQNYLNNNGQKTFPGFPGEFAAGYNPNGRAFPDLAAYANDFPVSMYGLVGRGTGTSFSAPITASLITLANEALLEQGYEPVGYVNQMLYWMAKHCSEAFNDITFGNNQFDSGGNKCQYGFNAAPGWDPVTGLGSIKFESFVLCAIKYQTDSRNIKKEK